MFDLVDKIYIILAISLIFWSVLNHLIKRWIGSVSLAEITKIQSDMGIEETQIRKESRSINDWRPTAESICFSAIVYYLTLGITCLFNITSGQNIDESLKMKAFTGMILAVTCLPGLYLLMIRFHKKIDITRFKKIENLKKRYMFFDFFAVFICWGVLIPFSYLFERFIK